MVKPSSSAWTQIGSRHKKNDDYALVNAEHGIFILCDGVSEGDVGDFASQCVAKVIQEKLIQANRRFEKADGGLTGTKRLQAMQDVLLEAYTEAQSVLRTEADANSKYRLAATTCITLWLHGRFAIMAHIGDSRAYLSRAGKVYPLTKDHSAFNQMVAAGASVSDAKKNPMARALTKAMGNCQYTQPDLFKMEFQAEDLFFMCTDGVYTAFKEENVLTLSKSLLDPQQSMAEWMGKCAYQSGDDSTLVQIQFPSELDSTHLIRADDRLQLMQKTPLCRYMDFTQVSHIATLCEIENYKAGSIIIQENTDGDTLYMIAKGTLEVLISGVHLKYLKQGNYFGEIALVQNIKRTATVQAKEDVILLSLKRSDLIATFKEDPFLQNHFLRAMLDETVKLVLDQGNELIALKKL